MNEIITEIRNYIVDGYYTNEENIRFSLVGRILKKLGWDIWNPKEVATEFNTVPNEDKSRVDIALFENPNTPSVFIEIKALGKLESELSKCETQLRDYNRNNTAPFSVITDGRIWRFYYSQTGGEFSQKCFKVIDIINTGLDDIELSLDAFLSKDEIRSGNAKKDAETYLRMNLKQRAMDDAFPKAKTRMVEPPYPSLPIAIVEILKEKGLNISVDEAQLFIEKQNKKTLIEVVPNKTAKSIVKKSAPSKRGKFPPNGSICKFNYKDAEITGEIKNDELYIPRRGSFKSFSGASESLTKTSRNGWLDWDIQLPNQSKWIQAKSWRKHLAKT